MPTWQKRFIPNHLASILLLLFQAQSMTEDAERRPREMQEEVELEKKKKTQELEELAKEMEREYENRVKKALAQLRF